MKLIDIVKACNGKVIFGDEDIVCEDFSKDTRTIKENDVYVGIKGENFDGNILYEHALEKGAKVCVLQGVSVSDDVKIKYSDRAVVIVEDTIKALQQIAEYKRTLYDIPVVAITGSVGKTSTKDIIASVVGTQFKVLKTEGNLNNHIGVPLTILGLKDHNALVVEMGMNNLGEISVLSKIAKPDIAVITNVGTSHIGNLGSRQNILKAKLEILDGLKEDGILIINNDNDLLNAWAKEYTGSVRIFTYGIENESDVMAKDIVLNEDSSVFEVSGKEITVPIGGKHFVYNALSAVLVGLKLGISMEKIKQGIQKFELSKNRMQLINLRDDIIIINDCYNANYDSMKASIEYLAKTKGKRKIAILGDMLELGEFSEELHKKVGEVVSENNIDILITVGEMGRVISNTAHANGTKVYQCKDNEEAVSITKNLLQESDIVLVKASNGMRFIHIVDGLSKIKLAVIFGGMSTEHDVSIVSGSSVIKKLDKEKYDIVPIYINKNGEWFLYTKNIEEIDILGIGEEPTELKKVENQVELLKSVDVAFPVLHGLYGEDGTIQGMLELLKVPYVGCKVLGSALCMDKVYTKVILDRAGINQAKYVYIRKCENNNISPMKKNSNDNIIYTYIDDQFNEKQLSLDEICNIAIQKCGLPVFVKPSNSGSSVGINKAKNLEELKDAIIYAGKFDTKILVEENIDGRELECAVIGNEKVDASCVGEILPAEDFYSFDAKYNNSESRVVIPADIDEQVSEEIRKIACQAFKAVDGKGLSRVDFFLEKETNKIYLNEINTMPGFTTISMYPQLWEKCGKSYDELLDELVRII